MSQAPFFADGAGSDLQVEVAGAGGKAAPASARQRASGTVADGKSVDVIHNVVGDDQRTRAVGD